MVTGVTHTKNRLRSLPPTMRSVINFWPILLISSCRTSPRLASFSISGVAAGFAISTQATVKSRVRCHDEVHPLLRWRQQPQRPRPRSLFSRSIIMTRDRIGVNALRALSRDFAGEKTADDTVARSAAVASRRGQNEYVSGRMQRNPTFDR